MIDIIIAVVIDFIIGDPYWFPHPVIFIGKIIRFLEKTLRKFTKTNLGLKISGGIIVLIVAFISFIVPYTILYFAKDISWLYHLLNVFIIWTTIAAKCLHKEGIKVYYALKNKDLKDARKKLSYIVGRETKYLSQSEVIRADVETIAENTSDGVIAPLIFAMIGGAPLAMMYKGINTMDSMLGYINDRYKYIGFFPAKIDDVFNFIPARITGIFMCLVSPIVKGNIVKSFKIMFRDRKNHKSPNCAYPEGAAAGALNIQLGGTNIYFGKSIEKPTIGDKIEELSEENIVGSIKLMYASEVMILVVYVILCNVIKF